MQSSATLLICKQKGFHFIIVLHNVYLLCSHLCFSIFCLSPLPPPLALRAMAFLGTQPPCRSLIGRLGASGHTSEASADVDDIRFCEAWLQPYRSAGSFLEGGRLIGSLTVTVTEQDSGAKHSLTTSESASVMFKLETFPNITLGF